MSLFKEAEGQLQTFCSLDCKFLGLDEEKTLRAELGKPYSPKMMIFKFGCTLGSPKYSIHILVPTPEVWSGTWTGHQDLEHPFGSEVWLRNCDLYSK